MVVWGLDPQYFGYRKVFIKTIMEKMVAKKRNGYIEYYWHDRPVSRVEIVGVVVDIKRTANRIVFTVDDGTGLIRCMKFLSQNRSMDFADPLRNADVGTVVIVQGIMEQKDSNEFEYQITLKVNSMNPSIDPNMELYHWTTCMYLDDCEYSVPARAPNIGRSDFGPSAHRKNKETFDCLSDGSLCICNGAHNKRVKAELLYCPCVSSSNVADPKAKFRLLMLSHLLELNHLVFSESSLTRDEALRANGRKYLVEARATEIEDVYGSSSLDHSPKKVHDTEYVAHDIDETKIDTLISQCFQSIVRDGIFAPLNARSTAGTHQLVTRDLIQKLLKATVISNIRRKWLAVNGEEPESIAASEITSEIQGDPHMVPDSIASLQQKAPFLPRWRMESVVIEL